MDHNFVTAMSYNLRYDVKEGGVQRMRALVSHILSYSPDIIGVQEETPVWKEFLLSSLSRKYVRVGEGRKGASDETEANEAAAVYYDVQRFTLLHTVTKWLSETPDIPSRNSGAHFPRSVTFAVLKCKETGKKLVYANTHFDCGPDEVREAESLSLTEIRRGFGEVPFLISGDFNFNPDSSAYKLLCDGGLTDASRLAIDTKLENTFHGYGKTGRIIDYFFITKEIKPQTYRVLSEKHNDIYTSDHYPIILSFDIEK